MSVSVGQSVRLATKYTPWTVYLSPSSAKYGWFQGGKEIQDLRNGSPEETEVQLEGH